MPKHDDFLDALAAPILRISPPAIDPAPSLRYDLGEVLIAFNLEKGRIVMLIEGKTYGTGRGTWLATKGITASNGATVQALYDLHYQGEGERGLVLLDTPGEGPALHLVHRTDRAGEYRDNAAFTVYPNARIIVQNDPAPFTLDRRLFLGEVDQAKARAFGERVILAIQADHLFKIARQ